jgi:hypothetical protein
MSDDTYANMGTDELIQRFADTAKRTGSGWSSVMARPESVRKALVKEMQAMGAELRARKPIAKLRRLLENEDRDVRGWAGAQFDSIDPEWADATISSLAYHLTVREVLAFRQRVLKGAPPGPPLKDMTIEQLVDSFKDACTRLYGTTRFLSDEEGGGMDMAAYNHVAGDVHTIVKELAGRRKLDALLSCLDDPLITTRGRAAYYCLPIATDRAVAVLEAISATNTWPEDSAAHWTLWGFRNGTYYGVSGTD